MKDIRFRLEEKSDYRETETVLREAFWNQFAPGCIEHFLLHSIRDSSDFLPELDIVATYNGKIIANIDFTKSMIISDDGKKYTTLCLGPIGVLPSFQKEGIGGALIDYAKKLIREMDYDYRAIFLFGDPNYYSRQGFVPAENYTIRTSDNYFAAAHQVYPLYPGALDGITGRYFESPAFVADESAAEIFDKQFPEKEKLTGVKLQPVFNKLVKMVKKYQD